MFLSSLFGNPLSFATPQTSFLSQLQLRPSSFQKRFAVANYRPKRMLYKKRMKGFFKTHKGGSLRGTSLAHGDYGLQFLEGGRIKDCQLDTIRNNLKRILKTEKEAKLHLNVFPDRPVTAKGNGTRMGKGKGPVDYFGCWVSPGRLAIEISGARKDLSLKALRVAALMLPFKTKVVVKETEGFKVAPRCLPHFVRMRLVTAEQIRKTLEYTI